MTTEYTPTSGGNRRPFVRAIWAEAENSDPNRDDTTFMVMGSSATESGLPWPKNTDDLKLFREDSRGHSLIMGRKTFEHLPAIMKTRIATQERPIIVLTSEPDDINADPRYSGATIQAIHWATQTPAVMLLLNAMTVWEEFAGKPVAVIGGPKVIQLFEPFTDEAIVTQYHERFVGDVPAPEDRYFDTFPVRNREREVSNDTFVRRVFNREA